MKKRRNSKSRPVPAGRYWLAGVGMFMLCVFCLTAVAWAGGGASRAVAVRVVAR